MTQGGRSRTIFGEAKTIIRVVRTKVSDGKIDKFKKTIEQVSIPWLKAQDGMLGYYPGVDPRTLEFMMVSLWENVDSLKAINGEHWEKAHVNLEELPLIEEIYIRHYEVFGQASGLSEAS